MDQVQRLERADHEPAEIELVRAHPHPRRAGMAIFELSAEQAGRALGTFASTAASQFRHARAELEARLTKLDESGAVRATDRRQS